MERTITLHIPEKTYQLIEKQAEVRGADPAQIVLAWVNKVLQQAQTPNYATLDETDVPKEPLKALFGTLESSVVGIAERHDEYLAEGLPCRDWRV
jgi:hypothetical protein